jgi:uncharacterized membrane protein YhaH (DUF805 family)
MNAKNTGAIKTISFKDAYSMSWRRWRDHYGRSSRQEYWKWFVGSLSIALVLGLLAFAFGIYEPWLELLFGLACLVPSATITVRRLHDTGHSGKWVIPLLVILGIALEKNLSSFVHLSASASVALIGVSLLWVGPLLISYLMASLLDFAIIASRLAPVTLLSVDGIFVSVFLVACVAYGVIVLVLLIKRSKPDNAYGLEPQ